MSDRQRRARLPFGGDSTSPRGQLVVAGDLEQPTSTRPPVGRACHPPTKLPGGIGSLMQYNVGAAPS